MNTLPYANENKEKERWFFIVETSHHGRERMNSDASPSMSSDKLFSWVSSVYKWVAHAWILFRAMATLFLATRQPRFIQGLPGKASDLR